MFLTHLPRRSNRLEVLYMMVTLADIRMVFLDQSQIGLSNFSVAGITRDAKHSVVVLVKELPIHVAGHTLMTMRTSRRYKIQRLK